MLIGYFEEGVRSSIERLEMFEIVCFGPRFEDPSPIIMCLNSSRCWMLEITNGAKSHKRTSVSSQKETHNLEFDMKISYVMTFLDRLAPRNISRWSNLALGRNRWKSLNIWHIWLVGIFESEDLCHLPRIVNFLRAKL